MRYSFSGVRVAALVVLYCSGCATWTARQADRQVYDLIGDRQAAAIGLATDADIGRPADRVEPPERAYDFTPRPLDPEVPDAFAQRVEPVAPAGPAAEEDESLAETVPPTTAETLPESLYPPELQDQVQVFSLRDALAYATHHGRDLQDAKEELYLAALDLTLERHLWTPQFVASVQADYTGFPDSDGEGELDRALTTVSEVAVSQRLPYGGEVSARVIHSALRDVIDEVNTAESGDVILSAELPLLRGAGRVAYETRYVAERELIYAVRRYERFRRSFLVDVAARFFGLQQQKAAIANIHKSYLNRRNDWEKADFIHRMGRSRTIFDAPRARANFRAAEAQLVSAKEGYATALDRFKIFIGMPVDALLDVVDQAADESAQKVDLLLPDVDRETAVDVATRYRLDLLTSADRVDDAKRGVVIARNRILPDLDLTGSVTFESDRDQLRAANLREERSTWQGGVEFRIDDRKTERTQYRSSLVSLRQAQRDHEEFTDVVRADVRRALRQIGQQENLRRIQAANVTENLTRYDAARAQFDLGLSTNQDVVDAQNDLLDAQNDLAAAIADYRVAILELRLATGTLRVTDDGRWVLP